MLLLRAWRRCACERNATVGITSSPSTALLIAVQSGHGVDVTGIGVKGQSPDRVNGRAANKLDASRAALASC